MKKDHSGLWAVIGVNVVIFVVIIFMLASQNNKDNNAKDRRAHLEKELSDLKKQKVD
jgi:hypothetical protein